MKNSFEVLLIYLIAAISFSCEDEEVALMDYPIIRTHQVTNTPDGLLFSAEIVSLGNDQILDYGFVWSDEESPTVTDYNKSLLGPDSKIEKGKKIAINVTWDILNSNMYVRAYIKNNKYTVYGNQVKFIGHGSSVPRIIDFHPKTSAIGGEKMYIIGENFSSKKEDIEISLGDGRYNVKIIEAYNDSIVALTPAAHVTESVQMQVTVRNLSATAQTSLNLISPLISVSSSPFNDVFGLTTFTMNDIAYAGGGIANGHPTKSYYKFDVDSKNWLPIQDFGGSARYSSKAINNLGIVAYGNSYMEWPNDAWQYNPENNNWTLLFEFGPGTYLGSTIVALGDVVYSYFYFKNEFWAYDTIEKQWHDLATPELTITDGYVDHNDRLNFSIVHENELLFFSNSKIWNYVPTTNQWSMKGNSLNFGVAAYNGSRLFLINNTTSVGGISEQEVYEYDFTNGELVIRFVAFSESYSTNAFILKNQLYVLQQNGEIWTFNLN